MTTKPERFTRVAIFTKPGKGFGIMAVDLAVPKIAMNAPPHFGEYFNVIASAQPDFPHPFFEIGSRERVEKRFYDALATSHERGWKVEHLGERNYA